MSTITRTDKWCIGRSQTQHKMLSATVDLYRQYVKSLIGVVWVHAVDIAKAKSACSAVESLIHKTKDNPNPRYRFFDSRFPKFPSYLRRAAIEAALGQASSFITRYDQWVDGKRKTPQALPPKRTNENTLNPVLYRGQCIKFNENYSKAEIKVWNGSDWVWTTVNITSKRQRHTVSTNKALSPTLFLTNRECKLSIPFESKVTLPKPKETTRVCGVDLGINSTAVASIVDKDGTVLARKFIHPAEDIDRRDRGLSRIGSKAKQSMGSAGKLSPGFCKTLYRKAASRNREITRLVCKQIVDFAKSNGVQAIVFERLKGFRPKGGRAKSSLRQRFHGWLHRDLVKRITEKAEELSLRVKLVHASGTSKYAYDGSGLVSRDNRNRTLATFNNGRQYNCDLSASYNIAARGIILLLGLKAPESHAGVGGKSSTTQPRTPVTLSTLWLYAKTAS